MYSFSYLQIFVSLIALVIDIFVQIFSFRFILRLGLLKSVYLGFVAGFFGIFLIEFYIVSTRLILINNNFIFILIANLVIYISLEYCYFNFVNLGETARRIRILWELCDSKEGLSVAEILERYNAKDIIEKRLSRLINHGQIICKDGRYYIGNSTMLLIARIIVRMKLILLGKKSEFE